MAIIVNKTNALQYIASYQDLINAFGVNNIDAAISHYSSFGRTEGREFLFDGLAYINSYADLIAAFGGDAEAGARHYLTHGIREDRDADLYEDGNGTFTVTGQDDVTVHNIHTDLIIAADGSTFGSGDAAMTGDLTALVADNNEVNSIEVLLGKGDTTLTLNDANDDVTVDAGYVASGHTLFLNGVSDVAVDDIFYNSFLTIDVSNLDIQHPTVTLANALEYIASYADLIAAFGKNAQAGVTHFAQFGENEGRYVTFDGLAYINQYDDLIAAFGDDVAAGVNHYLTYGIREGREGAYRTNVELNLEGDASGSAVYGVQSNMHIDASSYSGGLSVVILDDDEADEITITAGHASSDTSSGYTIATGDVLDNITVDATLMGDNEYLRFSGAAASVTVNHINDNVTVTGWDFLAAGTLTVNIDDDNSADNDIHVWTGADDTFINAADDLDVVQVSSVSIGDGSTITLTGAADFEVSGASDATFTIDASETTGLLEVLLSGGSEANTLSVITGNNDTSVTAHDGSDTVAINALLMGDSTTLTLSGSADFTVNGIDASMDIVADNYGGSGSTVTVNTVDDAGEDSIEVYTGIDDTTINASDALDNVTVWADLLAYYDYASLVLNGASDVTVYDVNESSTIDASNSLTGTLDILTSGDGNYDVIDVLTGTNNTTVTDLDGEDNVDINFDAIDDNKTIEINGAADFYVSGYNDVSLTVDAADTSGYVSVSFDGGGAANTLNVIAGTYNTYVAGLDENDTVVIDADRMGNDTLTLDGDADFTVNNVSGGLDIVANNVVNGTLTVKAFSSGGNTIDIRTGTNNTTVNVLAGSGDVNVWTNRIGDGKTIDLNGAAYFDVSGGSTDASFTIDAADTTNTLHVGYSGSGGDSTLTVITGTDDTYIYAWESGDAVTVAAGLMVDNKNLNVSGSADFTINGVDSSLEINSGYWGLDGELTVNAIDDVDDDFIEIWAGDNYTTVNDLDELDDVTIYADRISAGNDVDNTYRSNDTTSNDAGLTLSGKADFTVYDLSTSLRNSSIGDDTIYLAAANDNLSGGGGILSTDGDRRDMSIDLRAFDGEGNQVSHGDDLIVLDNTLIDGNTSFIQIFGFDTEDYADRIAINTGWGVSTSDTLNHWGYGDRSDDEAYREGTAAASTANHALFDMNFASELDPNNGADISGFLSGSVIEISSTRSVANPTNLAAVKGMLGLIAGVESNAEFLVIVYSGEAANANAFLYHVYSDNQGDGFDFHDTDLNGDDVFDLYYEDGDSYYAGYGDGGDVNGDRFGDAGYGNEIISEFNHDMIDLVGVFYNVGADSFTSENFSSETNMFGG